MGVPSFEIPKLLVGVWPANKDMSAEPVPGQPTYQFTVVDLEAPTTGVGTEAGAAINTASAGYPALGILQDNPPKGFEGTVMIEGISKAKIGTGGCSVGPGPSSLLMSDGLGSLIPATSGNYAIAKALVTATAGSIVPVLLKNFGKI